MYIVINFNLPVKREIENNFERCPFFLLTKNFQNVIVFSRIGEMSRWMERDPTGRQMNEDK